MDIKKLSAEQKVKLVMGADSWTNYDVDGQLYKFVVSDGPIGLRKPTCRDFDNQSGVSKSVAYPSAQMLSHTWNLSLARLMGNAIANDCIEQDVDIILGPGVNIKRLPVCGRNFEYFSEDPYLAGMLAREYIRGVQEKHVGTSLKHFCCNNSEYSRQWASMEVDERVLREIYLKAFEIACQAEPWTVMSSYNLVNGVRMSEHKKLYGVLRKDFGFDGLIMSDWDAVKDSEASLNAGCNLEMPFNKSHGETMLAKAEKGELCEEALDESASRVIALAEKCQAERKLRKLDMTLDDRRNVALTIAEQGTVLLKNNGVLPIKTAQNVLVTGAPAHYYYFGGGSSNVDPEREFVPLADALVAMGVNAEYFESVGYTSGHQSCMGNLKACVAKAAEADCVIVTVGNPNNCEFEGVDRIALTLSPEEKTCIRSVAKVCDNVIVAVYAGAPVEMSDWIDDVSAVIWAGYGGEYASEALSNILLGKVNPSGKLTETFPLKLQDVPAYGCYADEAVMRYTDGLDVGYRYYETYGKPVLFPFGFGLSYSEFVYSDINVQASDSQAEVSFAITNTSDVDGTETAQVYVRELTKEVYRPVKELKGFARVELKAGETKTVRLTLNTDSFAYYSTALDCWKVKGGTFEIQVGASCSDIRLKKRVKINERGGVGA